MHSTNYTLFYTFMVTAIPAVILASMYLGLKPIHDTKEASYNNKQILSSLNAPLKMNAATLPDNEAEALFANVEQAVVNTKGEVVGNNASEISMEQEEKKPENERLYPVFIYKDKLNGKSFYILSVRGNGLWDKIWGWVALEGDKNTVAGAAFGHKGETPGLGAEITDNAGWKAQFIGRKIYDANGKYVSVNVRKGGAVNKTHEVDGISGATVTSVGVSDMLYKGIAAYEPYLKSLK